MGQIALGASLADQAAGAVAEGGFEQVVPRDDPGVPGPLCERSGPCVCWVPLAIRAQPRRSSFLRMKISARSEWVWSFRDANRMH